LRTANLSALRSHGTVQRHVSRFERRHAHLTAMQHSAQIGHLRGPRGADARNMTPSRGLNLPAATYGLIEAIAPWKKPLASFGARSRFSWLSQKSASCLSAQTPAWGHLALTVATALLLWLTRTRVLVLMAAGAVIGATGLI
jgi:hypothetical protein